MPDDPDHPPDLSSGDNAPFPPDWREAGEVDGLSFPQHRRLARRRAQVRKKLREARLPAGDTVRKNAFPDDDFVDSADPGLAPNGNIGQKRELLSVMPAPHSEPPDSIPPATGNAPRRFKELARPLRWWRQIVPTVGLALCLGCLWALLGSPKPEWQWPWKPVGPVSGVVVILDPGHGGGDTGAVAQGVVEKDLNLDVGQRIGRMLRARGVNVRLTREDDHFVPLEDRVRFANALPGAVFVSIHFNDASGNGQASGRASGIETYYCDRKLTPAAGWVWTSLLGSAKNGVPDARWAVREGQTLADSIQGALIAGTRAENRGIKERSLYVTHRVLGPAVLVEGGFVSHPGEARRLGDPVYRQVLAECIAEGITRYLQSSPPVPRLVAASGGPSQH